MTLTDKVRAALKAHTSPSKRLNAVAVGDLPELSAFPRKSVVASLSKLYLHEGFGMIHAEKVPGARGRLYWYEDKRPSPDAAPETDYFPPDPTMGFTLFTGKGHPSVSIPLILFCPAGHRHIDEADFSEKPHHTHACQECGIVWRPALVNTHGVQFLPGYRND